MNLDALRSQLASKQKLALLVGAAALVLSGIGAMADATHFFRGYLLGYMFWMNLTLGCLGFVMMHNLTGGDWGHATRRALEAGMRTLPLMLLLFLPILFAAFNLDHVEGHHGLYEWANPEHVKGDKILTQKASYLNGTAFGIRAAILFAFWFTWSYVLSKGSHEFEKTPNLRIVERMENWSGPGAVLFFLATTCASFDWVMSLEPHWYSTIYGVLFLVGQGLATLAFMIVFTAWTTRYEPFSQSVTEKHFHDLGKLMHGFVVLWAYGSFSQFLIIWSANLPEEIPWYLHRTGHGWLVLALFLMGFHFFVPFFVLLSRHVKRHKNKLIWVAGWMLIARYADLYWQIVPSFKEESHFHWLYLVPLIGIGGVWLFVFLWQLQERSLLPLPDNSYESAEAVTMKQIQGA